MHIRTGSVIKRTLADISPGECFRLTDEAGLATLYVKCIPMPSLHMNIEHNLCPVMRVSTGELLTCDKKTPITHVHVVVDAQL